MKIDTEDFKSWFKDIIKKINEETKKLNEKFPHFNYSYNNEDEIPCFYRLIEYIKEKEIHDPKGRYLIFYYYNYEADGGMEDLLLRINDLENFIEGCHATDGKPHYNVTCFDIETDTTFDLGKRISA